MPGMSCGGCAYPLKSAGECLCGKNCQQHGSISLRDVYTGEKLECTSDPEGDSLLFYARVDKFFAGRYPDPVEEVIITDKAEYVQELMASFSLCGSW